jgi:hypothetical protein
MANVYVEARPKGRPDQSSIEDVVVEDHADHLLHTSKTKAEAIAWARKEGHSPVVARVRHLNDKKNRTRGGSPSPCNKGKIGPNLFRKAREFSLEGHGRAYWRRRSPNGSR